MSVFITASNTNFIRYRISLLLVARNSSSKLRSFKFYIADKYKLIIYVVECKALKLILGFALILFIRGPPC